MAANPNTVAAGIQEHWDKRYTVTLAKVPVFPAIVDTRLAAMLRVGDTVHREYRNSLIVNTMGADGSFIRQAITDTDETLLVDQEKETSFYIKELDEIQNHLKVRDKHAYDAAVALFLRIDGDILGEYDKFTNNVDDGDLAGTDGNGITATASNVQSIFLSALKKLQRGNVLMDNGARFTGFRPEDTKTKRGVAVISPDFYEKLLDYLGGKESALGDRVGTNGHVGRFMNLDLFLSNATGWSATLLIGTQATDGNTVTINGVVLRFKTSIAQAGDLLIGANAATSNDALVALVNDSESLAASIEGTLYWELTDANRALLQDIVATDGATETVFKAEGHGYVAVSETLTASADVWTPALQVQHLLFGQANAIDLAIQKRPNLRIQTRSGYVGSDVVTWTVYGKKVFNDAKARMIDVKVRSDAY